MFDIKPVISPLERAINVCGSQAALAKKIGVTPQAVQQWLAAGAVPIKRALQVEAATGGQVTRSELCPEMYPPENDVVS